MPMYKKSMLVLLVLAMMVAGGTMYGYHEREKEMPLDAAVRQEKSQEARITVYVTGAVNRPGVASLPEGSRVADAVNACGGVLPTAAADGVNMAQVLKDGIQIRVPEKAPAGTNPAGTSAVSGANGLVNINTADEKALDTLPGIGPAMAKRILEYRQQQGSFQQLEDIKKVKGIGDAKYEKLKDKITL
jgi:competence protein ComEA